MQKSLLFLLFLIFTGLVLSAQNNRTNYRYNKNKVSGVFKVKGMKFKTVPYQPKELKDNNIDTTNDAIKKPIDTETISPELISESRENVVQNPTNYEFDLGLSASIPFGMGIDAWLSINKFFIGAGVLIPMVTRSKERPPKFWGYNYTADIFLGYKVKKFSIGGGMQITPTKQYAKSYNDNFVTTGESSTKIGFESFLAYQITNNIKVYNKVLVLPGFIEDTFYIVVGLSYTIKNN